MRALFDANVFVSYLLTPTSGSPPTAVVEAAFATVFTLLTTAGVLEEVRRKAATKPYLAERITPAEVEQLASILERIAEAIPEIEEELPEVGRDRKDDYLLAHAVLGKADYLVSGDNDLLSLDQVDGVRIVSPAEFLRILQESGLL